MKANTYRLQKGFWTLLLLLAFAFAQFVTPSMTARADDEQEAFAKYKARFTPGEAPQLLEQLNTLPSPAGSDVTAENQSQWQLLYFQGWESASLPGATDWLVQDFGTAGQSWGDTSTNKNLGSWSMAATAKGTSGFGNGVAVYGNDAVTTATYGPFSLENYADAKVDFFYNLHSEFAGEYFCYSATSNGGINFNGECVTGFSGGWVQETLSLKQHIGRNDVYIEFFFMSDNENNSGYFGVFVDDIAIQYSTTAMFASNKTQDGWVLESSKGSNKGGSMNAKEKFLRVGDDAQKRQYRSFISFNTAPLPDAATIEAAWIRLTATSGVGEGGLFGGITLDIRNGAFGAPSLELADFNRASSANNARGKIALTANNFTVYHIPIDPSAIGFINKTGITQLRLRLTVKTNNNSAADYRRFFSAEAGADKAPKLFVQYTP